MCEEIGGEFEKTSGTQWDIGAISTAEWEGDFYVRY